MKKLVSFALVLAMLFSFASIAGAEITTDPVTLRVVVQDDHVERCHNFAIEYITEKYPNVTVDIVPITSKEYKDKITVMLAGGDDVDVLYSKDPPQYSSMVANGQLLDLTSFIERDKLDLSIYNGGAERYILDGKLYGLPFRGDVWALFYNKDLFDKAGVAYPTNGMTWSEYADLAKKMTSGEGVDKVYGAYHHTWRSTVNNIAVQDGKHTVIAEDGDYNFMRPAYEMVLDLQDSGAIMDYAMMTTGNLHYTGAFYNQQIAMCYMGSWALNYFTKEDRENGLGFEWDVVRAPHPDTAEDGQVIGIVQPMCIAANTKNADLAWEYIKYLGSVECAYKMAATVTLPAAADEKARQIMCEQEYVPAGTAEALWYSDLNFETPVSSITGVVGNILDEEHSLVMTNSCSLDEFIKTIGERVLEAIEDQ